MVTTRGLERAPGPARREREGTSIKFRIRFRIVGPRVEILEGRGMRALVSKALSVERK
jgi:hypothetical protein